MHRASPHDHEKLTTGIALGAGQAPIDGRFAVPWFVADQVTLTFFRERNAPVP